MSIIAGLAKKARGEQKRECPNKEIKTRISKKKRNETMTERDVKRFEGFAKRSLAFLKAAGFGGGRSPVETVLTRSTLQLRSVLDACHWHTAPEPAGETPNHNEKIRDVIPTVPNPNQFFTLSL